MKQPTLRTEIAIVKTKINYLEKLMYLLILAVAGGYGIEGLEAIKMGVGL